MKYFLASLLYLTIFFGCNSDKTNTAGGITSPVTSETIADGKSIVDLTDSTFNTVAFQYNGNKFMIDTANGEPFFYPVMLTAFAPYNIYDSNEFLTYDLRTYAITLDVFDNLVLEAMPASRPNI